MYVVTDGIALYANGNNATYFGSFGDEHISKEIKKFNDNKNIITNLYRMQAYDSITCGYFYIRFISFIFKGKCLDKLVFITPFQN